jgi:hypothetical protein
VRCRPARAPRFFQSAITAANVHPVCTFAAGSLDHERRSLKTSITKNGRGGKSPVSHQVIVSLIAATARTGL